MIRPAAHAVLESFAASNWSTGPVLWHAGCTGCPRPYRHTRASLSSVGSLHVVRALSHADSWTRLELLDWLSAPDTNRGLVLTLRLLVRARCSLLVLLLLLIHVRRRMQGTRRTRVGCRTTGRTCAWLLQLGRLIHIARCAHTHGGRSFLIL